MADFRKRIWATRSRPPIAAPRLIDEEINPPCGWIQLPDCHCLLVDLPGFKKDDIKLNVEESGIIVVSGRRRIGEGKQVHFEKSFNVPEDGDIMSISTLFEEDTLRVSVPKGAKQKEEEPEKTNGASSSDTNREDPEKSASTNDTEQEEEKEKTESPASSSDTEEKKREEYESPASSSDTNEKRQDEFESPPSRSDNKEETEGPASRSNTKEEPKKLVPNPKEGKTQHVDPVQGKESSSPAEKSSQTSPVMVKLIENKGILIASILSFTLGVLLSQKFHPLPPK